jgi:hypothetical protein
VFCSNNFEGSDSFVARACVLAIFDFVLTHTSTLSAVVRGIDYRVFSIPSKIHRTSKLHFFCVKFSNIDLSQILPTESGCARATTAHAIV